MDLNEQLETMKNTAMISSREEKIQETIARSKDAYYQQSKLGFLTAWEFLWTQFQYTRKRWWLLQGGLLLAACRLLPAMEVPLVRIRSTGAIGCMFVVLIIPELWRNRSSNAIQVEAVCMYSLRQIYSARILLFGIADTLLLTLFCLNLRHMGFTLVEVVSQFLLPVTVTAGICFSLLCRSQTISETASMAACLTWGGAWWLILMNETMYHMIAPPVWVGVFAAALGFLACMVRKTVRTTNQYWEVEFV